MSSPDGRPGPANSLTDIVGLRVGHYDRRDGGYLTGTTVVLAPEGGMVAGVDVRGGAPGTRETDLLHPTASIQRIHAITLTGGSAYGLAAANGVALALEERGIGFDVAARGPGAESAGPGESTGPRDVVPIVPAAVLFDLGRGGDFRARPDEIFGRLAVADALSDNDSTIGPSGCVGAGTGAVTCGIKGGLGMASLVLPGGITVAAMIVANAVGSPIDLRTGELLGARLLLDPDGPKLHPPSTDDARTVVDLVRSRSPFLVVPGSSDAGPGTGETALRTTTLGVIATDATLTKAQCTKLAGTAHDGLARALNPVHTAFDGDTLFGVSTSTGPVPDDGTLHQILSAAADVVTRSLVRALLSAKSVVTPAGEWLCYTDLVPSTVRSP